VARRQAALALLGEFLLVFLREDSLARPAADPAGPVLEEVQAEPSAEVGAAAPDSVV
jgi:hypothetical protein